MINDLATNSRPTLTLEECDEAFTQGVFLIRDAVLNYAQHGLTPTQIGSRVRALGATESDRTVYRWVKGFKADKLLPEKEKTQAAEKQQRYRERVTNCQNGKTLPPQPTPTTSTLNTLDPASNEELAPIIPATTEMGHALEAHLAATDHMDDQELHIARLEWERDIEHAGVEWVLRDYGRWDPKMGFFPDPPLTLIRKNLDNLNIKELHTLKAEIEKRLGSEDFIDV